MTSGVCSMPTFTQSAPMSDSTTRICSATKSAGTSWMENTPRVFCAVSAVTAVMA